MDVSRLYLWIPSAALFPLTAFYSSIWNSTLHGIKSLLDHKYRTFIDKFMFRRATQLVQIDELYGRQNHYSRLVFVVEIFY